MITMLEVLGEKLRQILSTRVNIPNSKESSVDDHRLNCLKYLEESYILLEFSVSLISS